MANAFDRSRSPVRAINTVAKTAWGHAVPRPRSWSEPAVHEIAPLPLPAPSADEHHLECPDCGAQVRLALVPAVAPMTPPVEHAARPGVADEPLPDFEESVSSFKKALIERALLDNDGVMTRAAKALGLKYTTFVAMVHRLDLDTSQTSSSE